MKLHHLAGELVGLVGAEIARQRDAGLMSTMLELSQAEYDQLTTELGGAVWAFPVGPGVGLPIQVDGKQLQQPHGQVVMPGRPDGGGNGRRR